MRRGRCHTSNELLFGHLKLHDKYLFDAKTCQIAAVVGDPKWGVLLVIICCYSSLIVGIKFFRRTGLE
jgi:hypothetical protein